MAINEIERFILDKLDSLPSDHSQRPFIEGLSQVVGAYESKPDSIVEDPTKPFPTMGESYQFAESLELNSRAKKIVARLYRVGIISSAQDLSHVPDFDLIQQYQLGAKTLANIRASYPYSPKEQV